MPPRPNLATPTVSVSAALSISRVIMDSLVKPMGGSNVERLVPVNKCERIQSSRRYKPTNPK